MTVTTPETSLRARVIDVLEEEFETELTVRNDRLNDSMGRDGVAYAGVYPGAANSNLQNDKALEIVVYVQIFLPWVAEVNPEQQVDPGVIEEYAERLRRACREDDEPGSGQDDEHMWFYSVARVEYPFDPTGNISRLLATVTGMAQNPALVETTG